jgi:hypothetical protein
MEHCHISKSFGIGNSTLCLKYRSLFRLQIILRCVTFPANERIIIARVQCDTNARKKRVQKTFQSRLRAFGSL